MIHPGDNVCIYHECPGVGKDSSLQFALSTNPFWYQTDKKVKSFTISAVMPLESYGRDADYACLSLNVARDRSGDTSTMHILNAFPASDARALHPACLGAVKAELEGLLSGGGFCLVQKRDLPAKARLLGGRLIRCMNNKFTPSEKFKTRFVVQGHRDA